MKGAQLECPLEMLPRLHKLDDISEPVLDEAERVLKKWSEDSPSWRNAVRAVPLGSPPPRPLISDNAGESLSNAEALSGSNLDSFPLRQILLKL